MTGAQIITKFEQYVDDTTELSATQELDLLNKVINKICLYRPWEFLKKSATGTLSTSVSYVALPSDFSYLVENNQTTDNAVGIDNNASPKVVFIGSTYTPYQMVNWSDRRQYRNQSGYAYIDAVNSRLYFTLQPTVADSYEFDYMSVPTALALTSETPTIPARFHDMLYHAMAVDDDIILRYPKAQSYAVENNARYKSYLEDMAWWNAGLQLN